MKYTPPKPTRETLLDLVVIDQAGKIWLQQDKKTAPEWALLRRHVPKPDVLGFAHEELTRYGFIVHELMILREGEMFWAQEGRPKRMPHVLVVAGVNYGEPPTAKDYYLEAFDYSAALKLRQHFSSDLKQLFDPTIDTIIRRQNV